MITMTNENNDENNRRPKSLVDLLEQSKPSVSVKYIPHLGEQSQPEGADAVDVSPDASPSRDQSPDQDPRSVKSGEAESLQNSDPVVKASTPMPDTPSQTQAFPVMDFPAEINPLSITNQSQVKTRPNPHEVK